MVEPFADSTELPMKEETSFLSGPVTYILLLFAILLIALVIRLTISTSSDMSLSMMIKSVAGP